MVIILIKSLQYLGHTAPHTDHKVCQLCYAANNSHHIYFLSIVKKLVLINHCVVSQGNTVTCMLVVASSAKLIAPAPVYWFTMYPHF